MLIKNCRGVHEATQRIIWWRENERKERTTDKWKEREKGTERNSEEIEQKTMTRTRRCLKCEISTERWRCNENKFRKTVRDRQRWSTKQKSGREERHWGTEKQACTETSALYSTLFLKVLEEVEAGDAGSSEDDGIAAGQALAQLLGHQAVELQLVLQGVQPVRPWALFQMDRNLWAQTNTVSRLFNRQRATVWSEPSVQWE